MAALVKVTGRRIEVIAQVIPDPPPAPPPSLPPATVSAPPPTNPPARDPWNHQGGIFVGPTFIPGTSIYERTITVSGWVYTALFSNGRQLGAWGNDALVKLYPDYHPQARTVIPEWDYFNW